MKRSLPRLFITALPLALIICSACGDGDGVGSLTLEEYLRRFDARTEDFFNDAGTVSGDALQAAEDAESHEEETDVFRNLWTRLSERYVEAVTDIGGLDPPPEAREAHNEWLATQRDAAEFLADLSDRAQLATSADEIWELNSEFDGPIGTDLRERAKEACLALQAIADDNGIDIELICAE